MIRLSIETFVNSRRVFLLEDLREINAKYFPDALSLGLETGCFDANKKAIHSNHILTFKGNLCRITIEEGEFVICSKRWGSCPLKKYANECKILS